MSRPATKADLDELGTELRTELGGLRTELRAEIKAEIKAALEPYATKRDLETWGSALYDLLKASQRETIAILSAEIARHLQASEERTRDYICALDDKYRDLPGRVANLEQRDRERER